MDPKNIEEMANAAPVVKFLNLVLLTAIRDQASDVHFEPFENEFKIRYRIDGTLLEIPPPPRGLALALCSRIKVMSNMDLMLAARKLPVVVGAQGFDMLFPTADEFEGFLRKHGFIPAALHSSDPKYYISRDDGHLSAAGNELTAEVLDRAIQSAGLVGPR
jgi:hypothetical protein